MHKIIIYRQFNGQWTHRVTEVFRTKLVKLVPFEYVTDDSMNAKVQKIESDRESVCLFGWDEGNVHIYPLSEDWINTNAKGTKEIIDLYEKLDLPVPAIMCKLLEKRPE